MTREGIKGAEYKSPSVAAHNATLPYTQNAVEPMDYTPVTFTNSGDTTYAHQLALSVIFLVHFNTSLIAKNHINQVLAKIC